MSDDAQLPPISMMAYSLIPDKAVQGLLGVTIFQRDPRDVEACFLLVSQSHNLQEIAMPGMRVTEFEGGRYLLRLRTRELITEDNRQLFIERMAHQLEPHLVPVVEEVSRSRYFFPTTSQIGMGNGGPKYGYLAVLGQERLEHGLWRVYIVVQPLIREDRQAMQQAVAHIIGKKEKPGAVEEWLRTHMRQLTHTRFYFWFTQREGLRDERKSPNKIATEIARWLDAQH